jgi:hypothetical protein
MEYPWLFPLPIFKSIFIPIQHSQSAESDPPTGPTLALVYLDRHHTGIPGFEQPPAGVVALRRDQVDCLGYSLVGRDTGAAQVLEPQQHVIVPPRRERKAGPRGTAFAISLDVR